MSGLRCWPGCQAMVVRANNPRNLGRTVKCIRVIVPQAKWELAKFTDFRLGPVWEVDTPLEHDNGSWYPVIADAKLVPLTPRPGSDIATTDDTAPCEVEPAHPDRVSA